MSGNTDEKSTELSASCLSEYHPVTSLTSTKNFSYYTLTTDSVTPHPNKFLCALCCVLETSAGSIDATAPPSTNAVSDEFGCIACELPSCLEKHAKRCKLQASLLAANALLRLYGQMKMSILSLHPLN
ncbi:hypothetical protein X801_00396 [Opisthorchis viverrini]|uniref:Uncharacterized protein n=1 Tax=Opisthorchis viverrini TaxID=6198 RepID=A0A1S8XAE6_OPIVI|nr:hypothetical protein X801_00396 [Opisthorchis viverrini]